MMFASRLAGLLSCLLLVGVVVTAGITIKPNDSPSQSNSSPASLSFKDKSHERVKATFGRVGGTITIRSSSDAYRGWPQLKLLMNGQPVGDPITVKASHADGHWQDI